MNEIGNQYTETDNPIFSFQHYEFTQLQKILKKNLDLEFTSGSKLSYRTKGGTNQMSKMLIIYYSWSNGNTKRIAEMLQEETKADIAVIDTVKPYEGSYDDVVDQGQDEVNRGYMPPIKPMVNQILCHISNTPLELIDYCQKNDIRVEAYSPIAHGEILDQPEIKAIADQYGVSVPQLCIRYTLQLGTVSLPKTGNKEHMKTNAEVDFEISAKDMETLKNFKKIESYGAKSGFPVYGGKL